MIFFSVILLYFRYEDAIGSGLTLSVLIRQYTLNLVLSHIEQSLVGYSDTSQVECGWENIQQLDVVAAINIRGFIDGRYSAGSRFFSQVWCGQ